MASSAVAADGSEGGGTHLAALHGPLVAPQASFACRSCVVVVVAEGEECPPAPIVGQAKPYIYAINELKGRAQRCRDDALLVYVPKGKGYKR